MWKLRAVISILLLLTLAYCAGSLQQIPPNVPTMESEGQGSQARGSTDSITGTGDRTGFAAPKSLPPFTPPAPGIYGPKKELSVEPRADGGLPPPRYPPK